MSKLTIFTDEQLDEIEKYTNAATPPPWDWAGHEFTEIQEVKDWLCRMVQYNPDNLFLHGVGHMLDGSHMPDSIDDVWAFVMPAITGNGPTAEANAKFLSVARQAMPDLVAELRRMYALESVLKKMLADVRSELAATPTLPADVQAVVDAAIEEVRAVRALNKAEDLGEVDEDEFERIVSESNAAWSEICAAVDALTRQVTP